MIKPRQAKAVFDAVEKEARHRRENEIDETYDEENLRVLEGLGRDDLPFSRQFDVGDHVGQGGVFDQINDLITATGQSPTECLGKNDVPDHPPFRETDGLGRQPLPSFDGKKGSPHILGVIGAAAQRKPDDRSDIRGQIDADVRKSEIPDEELHHQGKPAENDHVSVDKSSDP